MPTVVSLPRKVITMALSAVGNLAVGAARSGSAKGLVSNLANKVFVEGAAGSVADLDVAYWLTIFSKAGYTSAAGFKAAAEAVKPKLAGLAPEQVVGLVAAFHKAGCYDKDLFTGLGANISANFTKYDTEGLLEVLAAYHAFGHYSTDLLDDIADSITYCNHYLAPTKASPAALATALAAYAKAGHERGDLFTTLARGLSEVSFASLKPEARKEAALTALKAMHAFQFFPEQIEALLYVVRSESGLSTEEQALVDKATAAAEDAAGGELQMYKPNHDQDSTHWYGHHTSAAPSSYSLYCFRDSLVPTQYSPASFRPLK